MCFNRYEWVTSHICTDRIASKRKGNRYRWVISHIYIDRIVFMRKENKSFLYHACVTRMSLLVNNKGAYRWPNGQLGLARQWALFGSTLLDTIINRALAICYFIVSCRVVPILWVLWPIMLILDAAICIHLFNSISPQIHINMFLLYKNYYVYSRLI